MSIPDVCPYYIDKPGISILISDGKNAVYEPAKIRYMLDLFQNLRRTVHSESIPPYGIEYDQLLNGPVSIHHAGLVVALNPFSPIPE